MLPEGRLWEVARETLNPLNHVKPLSMRNLITPVLFLSALATFAQVYPEVGHGLPHTLDPSEVPLIESYRNSRAGDRGIEAPPSWVPRTMAEWEEVQSVIVTWTDYESILKQIVRYAKDECEVIIACTDSNAVITYLNGASGEIGRAHV